MSKKLTAKTQELSPKLPQFSSSFSKCISVEPETQELVMKKGSVYTIFEITGESNFDTDFVTKVVDDVLHESYYQSENISPVQSIEKAISDMRERVLQLSNDTLIADPKNIGLNVVSAILWGNVLYVVKFGDAYALSIHNGDISELEMISEGKYSSFSKLVNEDDVFVFCTKEFFQSYPGDKLLTSSILESDLESNQSCLLMRLVLDQSKTPEADTDLGLEDMVVKSKQREVVDKIIDVLKIVGEFLGNFLTKILSFLRPLIEKVKKLIEKIIPKRKAILLGRKITGLSDVKNKKTPGWIFLSAVAILLSVSVFYTLKSKMFKPKPAEETPIEEKVTENVVEEKPKEDRSKDGEYKIERVNPEVFFDIKITDSSAAPSEMQTVGNKIVIVDKESGKIYSSETATPNFTTQSNTYPNIKSIGQDGGNLSFIDGDGYKTYDFVSESIKNSFDIESAREVFPYSGYIYALSEDKLTRYMNKDGALTGTLWGQNKDFENTVSFCVAYNVYLTTKDGNLYSYSGGAKTDFSVTELDKPLSDQTKVLTDVDFSNIYISDTGNNRIVVLNKDGKLIKQYKNDNEDLWLNIKDIAVTSDEKTLFVLDSSKIYKINID
jgi:hypothetical protein